MDGNTDPLPPLLLPLSSSSPSLSPLRQWFSRRHRQPVAVDLIVGGVVGRREGELEGGGGQEEAEARGGGRGGGVHRLFFLFERAFSVDWGDPGTGDRPWRALAPRPGLPGVQTYTGGLSDGGGRASAGRPWRLNANNKTKEREGGEERGEGEKKK